MKKLVLFILCLMIGIQVQATNYFFSTSGNDLSAGTSSSTPYQTSTKHNTLNLLPGDTVFIKRGDVFTGTWNLSHSGNSLHPIVYTSYGGGAPPVISGFDNLTGFTSVGGGIYSALDTNLGADGTVKKLTINGVEYELGRFPKTTYRTISSHVSNTSITDPSLPNSPSYIGGNVIIKKNPYVLDGAVITGQSSGTLSFAATGSVPIDNWGYFINNSRQCLTQFGDWCYVASEHKIYVYLGTGITLSDYTIKASRYKTLFNITSGQSYISIKGIDFTGANSYAIANVSNTPGISVTGCTISNIGHDGIHVVYSDNLTFTGNNLSYISNMGIIVNATKNSTISNNFFNHCGDVEGDGENAFGSTGWGVYGGISMGTTVSSTSFGNTCNNNTLTNIGYIGIQIYGNGFDCLNNYVNGALKILQDGGGIYTRTGTTAIVYTNSRNISYNIVTNCPGNTAGTFGYPNQGQGFYLDDHASNITLAYNTSDSNGSYGYFFHNAHEVIFTGNTAHNNAIAQIAYKHDDITTGGQIRNITASGNFFISKSNTQLNVVFQSVAANSLASDITSIGTFSSNHYANTGNGLNLFSTRVVTSTVTLQPFSAWKTATGLDASSNFNSVTNTNNFNINPTTSPAVSTLASNFNELDGTSHAAGSYSLPAFRSSFLIFSSSLPAPSITYTPSTNVYFYGTTISTLSPVNTGGTVASYSITPSLTSGLGFSTSTGTISGTPTVTSALRAYSVTATNATGSSNTTVSILVNKANLSITAKDTTKIYGVSLVSASGATNFTSSGLIGSETIGSVTMNYGSGGLGSSTVGTYTGSVMPSLATGGTFNPLNYNITYVPGNITVSKKNLTIQATGPNKKYGVSLAPVVSATNFSVSGLTSGQTVSSVTLTPNSAGISPTTPVGSTYTVTPSAPSGTGGFSTTNYNVTLNSFNGTVAPQVHRGKAVLKGKIATH